MKTQIYWMIHVAVSTQWFQITFICSFSLFNMKMYWKNTKGNLVHLSLRGSAQQANVWLLVAWYQEVSDKMDHLMIKSVLTTYIGQQWKENKNLSSKISKQKQSYWSVFVINAYWMGIHINTHAQRLSKLSFTEHHRLLVTRGCKLQPSLELLFKKKKKGGKKKLSLVICLYLNWKGSCPHEP